MRGLLKISNPSEVATLRMRSSGRRWLNSVFSFQTVRVISNSLVRQPVKPNIGAVVPC